MRKILLIFFTSYLFLYIGVNNCQAQTPPAIKTDSARGPQTFAMIMGISTYKYIRPLTYADKDAEMFKDYLKSPAGGKVPEDNMYCLLNEKALYSTFWVKGMSWLKSKNLQKGDRLFFYLAGHGDAISQEEFYFLTYECNPAGDKNNYVVAGTVNMYILKSRIGEFSRKGIEVFFIMDACRSNELPGGSEGQQVLNSAISEKRAGEIIMLATGAGQESLEDASIGAGHGLFTYYLIDGLNGMADSVGTGVSDYKITLAEIQKYVDINVPAIAQQRFKRKQEPFFCCSENSEKLVGIVDTAYLNKWLRTKQLKGNAGGPVSPRGRGGLNNYPEDTVLISTYNLFNKAVKDNRLTGNNSAEYYYNLMARKFPGTSYTIDAQSTLAVEFINFAQSKITLYLECKDAASVQKIRAQVEESDASDETTTSLDRLEKVARQEFSEVGVMLEKAIGFIAEDDPAFAKTLQGRMYFFKARGYYGKDRRLMNINQAFQFAYSAYASDKNAAYILNTLASLHYDNNRVDSAIFYAKRAISSAPQWRYPYVTLAYAYKGMGRVDSALKYYRKAIQVDPGSADAYVDLGHYYYSLSRADSAIANYQKALVIDPTNVYASNNIGWLDLEKKNYNEAAIYFKKSIAADPKFISAYNGLSKAFLGDKKYDSARVYFAKAFSNYQDKSIVNIYIGNFYKELKLYDSAQSYYRAAIQADPSYEEAWNNLGRTFFETNQPDSANYYFKRALGVNPYSAFSLINIGMVFKEKKQPDSTYFYFQQAIRMEPTNPSVLNNLGVIYTQEDNYDSAKTYFKKALLVRPDYRPAYNNLTKIYRDQGQLDSVTNYLKSLPQFDPNSISVINDLGLIFLNQKRYDSATVYYRRAIKMDPSNPQLYNNMGLVMREMKQYDSARIYLQRSLQLDPENTTAMINLSNVFRQLRQYDSAGFYFKKQLYRRAPDEEQAWLNIGFFYNEMRVYDSAIYYFKKMLDKHPNHLSSLGNIGTAYMGLEKPDSAFIYYSQVVKIDPAYQNGSLNLGLLYHSLKRYDSAIVHIQNAIRLNPKNGKAYYNLACSYALNNQPEQAIQYLRQSFERGYKNYDGLLTDPDLFGLKNYKEFQAILDKYIPDWKERRP
ncbi:MAG TPA: tetratricopeptide repeat protein [Chitinophagaceae bacterium]